MAGFLKQFFKPRQPTNAAEQPEPQASTAAPERPAPDPDIVAKATTTGELETLATQGETAAIRREAIDRIEDTETLERISRALKGRDKGAFQAARRKLREQREQAEAEQARQAEIDRIVQDIEELASTQDTKLYQARLDAIVSRWNNVSGSIDSTQTQRYESALARCRERAQAIADEEARARAEQEQAQEQQSAVETLGATAEQLASAWPEEGASLSSLDAMIKTQRNRWEQATANRTPDPDLKARFEQLMAQLEAYHQALSAWQQHEAQLEQALQEKDAATVEETLAAINWPEGFPTPPTLARARKHRDGQAKSSPEPQKEAPSVDTGELSRTLDALEKSLEQQQLKPSREHFRKAQKLQDQLPEKEARQHQARITRLGRQLQELRDWLGFAARPKLESLCEQMEYLADQPMEPEAKAEHIHDLQQQWYDLGGTPDQQLWQRFKDATDRAYEPCHEYFSEKKRLKNANLEKREYIVGQLQEFVDNLDWTSCDYKAVDRIQRTARREWSDAKPVDYRANRPLQKQFDRLIKMLNAGLETERERNDALKRDVVERAEALVEHEPLREATEGAKALQKEWEAIGITHQQEDRRLWKAFRSACDRIFARLSEEREARDEAFNAAAEEAEKLIRQLQDVDPAETAPGELEQFRKAFQALELPRDRAGALADRFNRAMDGVQEQQMSALRANRYQQWLAALDQHQSGETPGPESFRHPPMPVEQATQETDTASQARALCIRVEIVSGAATPPEDQAQRMALQVGRLNEGMKSEQSLESQEDELDGLLATWCELDAADGLTPDHYQRLREALKHWFLRSGDDAASAQE
ncbi:DUF349 domain-containing protein [Vreelandella utahensis]|uniref:DUF349 domain-containing protein n=1 Tax=Vreelandella halophila TaxID=86177 RepID=UPI0009859437|nr:DUF349 domain-containing protein [Halomonas utahensis]